MKQLANGAKIDLIRSGRRGTSLPFFVTVLFIGMFYFNVHLCPFKLIGIPYPIGGMLFMSSAFVSLTCSNAFHEQNWYYIVQRSSLYATSLLVSFFSVLFCLYASPRFNYHCWRINIMCVYDARCWYSATGAIASLNLTSLLAPIRSMNMVKVMRMQHNEYALSIPGCHCALV